MESINKQKTKECCPRFHQEKWDGKTFNWEKKQFVKISVPTVFHVPFQKMLNKKITALMQKAEVSKKLEENPEDVLLLFNDPSAFKSDIYLSVTGDVPDAKNEKISGTFFAKVFDGSYKAVPKFIKKMDALLKDQNKKAKDYYVHYAYCPKCAEKFGHNYMILFAEIEK